MKAKLTSFIVIILMLVCWAAAAAAAPAGKVTNLEGRADISSAGQPAKPLLIGDAVQVGDIIRTKSASKCELTWIDGSIARLAPNSRLQVTAFNLQKSSRKTILSLFRGKIQNVVIATSKLFSGKGESQYEVHTPTSVCGVRGTTFFNSFENGVAGSLFTEGSGYMYSKGRPGDRKAVIPGVFMFVSNANRPPSSRSATPGETNKFFQDTNLTDKKKDDKKSEYKQGQTGAGASGAGGAAASSKTTEDSSTPPIGLTDLGGLEEGADLGGQSGKVVTTSVTEPVVEPTPVVPVVPPVVDETHPSVIMQTGVVSPSKDTTATFNLSSDSKTQATFEYNLNNAGWQAIEGNTLTLTDSSFIAGDNQILFRAKDEKGNMTKEAEYAKKLWAYYDLQVTSDIVTPTKSNSATFNLASTTTAVTYEYQLNNSGSWLPVSGNTLAVLAVLGKNTIQIRAKDQYGNVSRPVDYNQNTWNVGNLAKNVTTGGAPGVLSGVFPDLNFTAASDTGIFVSYLNGPEATLFDGSVYEGYLAGIPGSWRGLFTALYKNGSTIGILSSADLNDAAFSGGAVNAAGTIGQTEVGTTGDSATQLFPALPLLALQNLAIGQGFSDPVVTGQDYLDNTLPAGVFTEGIRGYNTSAGGILGVWGAKTLDGVYVNKTGATSQDTRLFYYNYYPEDPELAAKDYFAFGRVKVTDDLQGHVAVSGQNALTYLDRQYTGLVSLEYRGVYRDCQQDGNCAYDSVGAGVYNLSALSWTGDWGGNARGYYPGPLSLYENAYDAEYQESYLNLVAHEIGLLGGIAPFWTGASRFVAAGYIVDDYGEPVWGEKVAGPLLWNSGISGRALSGVTAGEVFTPDAEFTGVSTGIWKDGALFGSAYAIYKTAAGQAGWLIGQDTVKGVYESDAGFWKAEGNLTQTQRVAALPSGIASADLEVFHDFAFGALGGDFSGQGNIVNNRSMLQTTFYGKGIYSYDAEYDEYELEKIIPMRWGIYNAQIGAGYGYAMGNGYGNYFYGKPSGATAWTSKIGGAGPTQMQAPFFYLADITGQWAADGAITGQLNGRYMTPLYMGVLSGPFYGLYNVEGTDSLGEYGGFVGASIGEYKVAHLLAHSASLGDYWDGYSGASAFFTNSGGKIEEAGGASGILGGMDAPWIGSSSLTSLGLFNLDVEAQFMRGSYLWNAFLEGKVPVEINQTPTAGGKYTGYSAALWRADDYTGVIRTIYLTPADASTGLSEAGFLAGSLSGSVYTLNQGVGYSDDETSYGYAYGFWEASGLLTADAPLVSGLNPSAVTTAYGEMSAAFSGSFDGAGLLTNDSSWGEFAFFMNGSQPLPFGVYNLVLGGEKGGAFSGKPDDQNLWSAHLGGKLKFETTYAEAETATFSDHGYWIAGAAGSWNDAGEMTGNVTGGIYMTKTQTGTLSGPFYGLYSELGADETGSFGDWTGQSIGNYQGALLQLAGDLNSSQAFMFTRYEEGNPTHGWDDQSAMWGLLGSAELPWGSSHSFAGIGQYLNPNNRSLWWLETPSESSVEAGNRTTTADGGVLLGDMLGVNHADNTGAGIYAALFVRPDGAGGYKAGYLAYNVNSLFYPGLALDESSTGMWSLEANRYSFYEQAIAGVTPDDLNWDSEKLTDLGLVGKAAGAVVVDNFTSYKTSLTDQNWGFWSTTMADGVTTLPGNGWQAKAGGFLWGGNGYWLATLGGNAWTDGKVQGRIDYRYLTGQTMGAFGNNLVGAYQWNSETGFYDWQAASAGVYGGTDAQNWEKPLTFVSSLNASAGSTVMNKNGYKSYADGGWYDFIYQTDNYGAYGGNPGRVIYKRYGDVNSGYELNYRNDGTTEKVNLSYSAETDWTETGREYGTWDQSQSLSFLTKDPEGADVPDTYFYPSVNDNFGLDGLLGGVDSLWSAASSAPAGLTVMGSIYDVHGTNNQNWLRQMATRNHSWITSLESYNFINNTKTTYDGGAYQGFMGGIATPDGAGGANMSALLLALAINPAGQGGYLTGSATGKIYTDVNMFEMTGNLYPVLKTAAGDPLLDPAKISEHTLWQYGYNNNLFGDFGGQGWIQATGRQVAPLAGATSAVAYPSSSNFTTAGLVHYEKNWAAPWGIYTFNTVGAYSNPAEKNVWSAMTGGLGYFGAYNVANQHYGSYSYDNVGSYYNYDYNSDNRRGYGEYRRYEIDGSGTITGGTGFNKDYNTTDGLGTAATTTFVYAQHDDGNGGTYWSWDQTGQTTTPWDKSSYNVSSLAMPESGYISGGETGAGGVYESDFGLWLGSVRGNVGLAKELSGNLGGKFITTTKLGTLAGDVLGSLELGEGNSMQLGSLGVWEGQNLSHVNSLNVSVSSTAVFRSGQKNYEDGGAYSFEYRTDNYGHYYNYSYSPGIASYRRYGDVNSGYDLYYIYDGTTEKVNLSYSVETGWTETGYEYGTWDQSQSLSFLTKDPEGADVPVTSDYPMVSDQGYIHGLMGGVASLWSSSASSPADITIMGIIEGAYRTYYGQKLPDAAYRNEMWKTEFTSNNFINNTQTTYDGGAYTGFMGSVAIPDGAGGVNMSGLLLALAINPAGQGGYLTGSAAGKSYPEIGMFDMTGSLYPVLKTAAGDPLLDPAKITEHTLSHYGYNSNLFGDFGGQGWIQATGGQYAEMKAAVSGSTYYYNDFNTTNLIHYEKNWVAPWGIYTFDAVGAYSNPAEKNVWSATTGGDGYFGAYNVANQHHGSYSYDNVGSYYNYYYNSDNRLGYGEYRRYETDRSGKITGGTGFNKDYNTTDGLGTAATTTFVYAQHDDGNGGTYWSWDVTGQTTTPWDKSSYNVSSLAMPESGYISGGETGAGGVYESDFGLWLANVSGNVGSAKDLSGHLNGKFITYTKMGTLAGDVLGALERGEGNSCQLASLGLWEGQNLAHVAEIYVSPYYWDGSSWQYSGVSFNGLMGGLEAPWSLGAQNPDSLLLLGQAFGESGNSGHLFSSTVNSFNYINQIPTTYNGGAYSSFAGGVLSNISEKRDALGGLLNGLYYDPTGNVGVFAASFAGEAMYDIAMWSATGAAEGAYMLGKGNASGEYALTAGNFTSHLLNQGWSNSYAETDVQVTGADVQLRQQDVYTMAIDQAYLVPGAGYWSLYQIASGGAFSNSGGAPTEKGAWWTWEFDRPMGNITQRVYQFFETGKTEGGITTAAGVGSWVNMPDAADVAPVTGVNAGTLKGLFDPATFTFQSLAQGTAMETKTFLDKAAALSGDAAAQDAFMKATKIPCITVGTATLTQGAGVVNNLSNVAMNNVQFFAYATGNAPKIWATSGVNGNFTGAPAVNGPAVNLSGGGLNATFSVTRWDANYNNWAAAVNGNGNLNGSYSGPVNFTGGAAGKINQQNASFSGTGAGIVK